MRSVSQGRLVDTGLKSQHSGNGFDSILVALELPLASKQGFRFHLQHVCELPAVRFEVQRRVVQ